MISNLAQSLADSLTLSIAAKAKELQENGVDVINFSVGEPDFETPDFIKKSAIDAINEGKTRYTKVSGIDELRESIAKKYKVFNEMEISKEEVIVSTGAKQNLINALFLLINPGDEVLIPKPYWLSYPEMVKITGGKSVFVPGTRGKISAKDLEKYCSHRTKALILNNPNNPTGAVYRKEELEEIGNFCVKEGINIIADEIYEDLNYVGKHISIGSLSDGIKSQTITVSGFSKSYAMTGWRLGYSVQNKEWTKALEKIQGHTTSNANTISQYAGLGALTKEDGSVKKMVETFNERRKYVKKAFDELGLEYIPMEGAFYGFFKVKELKKEKDSVEFCKELLEKIHIATVPGKVFGDDDYLRISYAISMEEIKEGMKRLGEYMKGERS
ncbi:MAG: pyridoxal phosphate-dependent aminotransferase [Tissierellia bacterium]|nr:pyridoxal phosphate-dependent aminotransferase [Tissierellia bacterium]